MSELDKLSRDRDRAPEKRKTRTVREIDLRSCPPGYNSLIWDLTLHFHDTAEYYGVQLSSGPLVTYAYLKNRLAQSFVQRPPGWPGIITLMITEFWENEIDIRHEARAIEQFCGVETFTYLLEWARYQLGRENIPRGMRQGVGPVARGQQIREQIRAEREFWQQPDAEDQVLDKTREFIARVSESWTGNRQHDSED